MNDRRHRKPWLPVEDALVRQSVVPEGRTLHAAKHRARKLGVHFTMNPRRRWTDREKALVLRHVVPHGRGIGACRAYLHLLGYRAAGRYTDWKYEGNHDGRM